MTRKKDFSNVLKGASEAHLFTAKAGEQVRLCVLHPGGHARNHVFQLHGHGWQEEPYTNGSGSKMMGNNNWSEWKGSQEGIGAGSHLNLLLTNGSGGHYQTKGDYLFRDQASFPFDNGLW